MILLIRHIWDVWQHGARPGFEGTYYKFSLMTPFFSPAPLDCPLPQIYIAGVNPYVCRLAGELAEGFHIHPFHSMKYIQETVLPNVEAGLTKAGRPREQVALATTAFVIAGKNRDEIERAKAPVRQQLSFYASTRTYSGGRQALHRELEQLDGIRVDLGDPRPLRGGEVAHVIRAQRLAVADDGAQGTPDLVRHGPKRVLRRARPRASLPGLADQEAIGQSGGEEKGHPQQHRRVPRGSSVEQQEIARGRQPGAERRQLGTLPDGGEEHHEEEEEEEVRPRRAAQPETSGDEDGVDHHEHRVEEP